MMQSRQPSCVSSLVDDGCLSPVVEVTVSGVAGGVEWNRVDRAGQTKAECLLSDASGTIRLVAWGSYASRLKNRLNNGHIYRIRILFIIKRLLVCNVLILQYASLGVAQYFTQTVSGQSA